MAWICYSNQLEGVVDAQLGGKATNLARLSSAGFRVPPWFAISSEAFRDAKSGRREEVLVRLREAYEARFKIDSGCVPVAIRSSAIGEDGTASSFAGQLKTFLYVDGPEAVSDAVEACWESARGDGLIAYCRAHGLDDDISMAVVVQEMIRAESSGVLFTANPTTGDCTEMHIRAAFGLGEGVVADLVDTDGYRIRGSEIVQDIAKKTNMVVRNFESNQGTVVVSVSLEQQLTPCLGLTQLRELETVASKIATHFGAPQDIEWAFAQGILYILQSRPITALKSSRSRPEITWDNSNITESYCGVTSALTFSFASNAYQIVYQQVSELLGVPPDVIRANPDTYRNMLGLMKGRIFYNLKNWYRLVALLPGFESNKKYMEQMMGVKQASQITVSESRAGLIDRWTSLARVGVRLLRAFLGLDRMVAEFLQRFYNVYEAHRRKDLANLAPHEIVAMYETLEREILLHWKAPIVTDIFAMVFYGLLKRLCESWCLDKGGTLQNDLLCGEGGIASTEPTIALQSMAKMLQNDPELLAAFNGAVDPHAWLIAHGGPLRNTFDEFLDRYGFRCMNELKLEEPSLKDDPSFIFKVLRNYTAQPEADAAATAESEQTIRLAATKRVRQTLGFNPWKRAVFRWVLANARKTVKNRENMRFCRTKIFGLTREMFNALGAHFAGIGLLDSPRDIYHLTVTEVWGYIEGRSVCTNLRGLASLRKEEFERYRSEAIPDRFSTFGLPYLDSMSQEGAEVPSSQDDDPGVLRGVSCCPGVVAGHVRVVLSGEADLRLAGEILVAERTDPGWVPLYPSASGLLIERGSILSHSAIVARELGLPTIVGIKNLTKRVRDRQWVAMDARAGIVRLERESDSS